MEIYVASSIDLGGGYLVKVDGVVIYHMGDHANGRDYLMGEFTEEIDLVAARRPEIDLVFGPIRGCSLGEPEQVKRGIYYTLDELHPDMFVPMHTGSHTYLNKGFAQTVKKAGYTMNIIAVMHRGNKFHLKSEVMSD